MSIVHQIARNGFGTGTNDLYHKARPSYQPHTIAHIRNTITSIPPFHVAEIGSGTGIFTQALLSHPDWASAIKELKAVEPSEGMRSAFASNLTDDRVTVKEGTFESTGIDDGWADVVIIAQALHWCPDFDKASAEFARILKPNGTVAFIWNLEDRDRVAQLRELIESHEVGTPPFRLWRQIFDTASYKTFFELPDEKNWSIIFPITTDIAVDRACSTSYIAVLDEDDKAKVKKDIREIVERGDDKVWMNEGEGVFEYPYKTKLVLTRKKSITTSLN